MSNEQVEGHEGVLWGGRFAGGPAEAMFALERIPTLSTTHTSIEEISSKVLSTLGLQREMF